MSGGKHTLSLSEKINLIDDHERNKTSPKHLAEKYKIGKTQVYETLKNKNKIKGQWLSGEAGQSKWTKKVSSNEQINKAVWEWFVSARAKGMPISGPMIQAEALEVAQKIGKVDFKASCGWLDSFRKRHNIVLKKISGESKDVDTRTVEEWREKIPKIIEGYDRKNIFNGDETGIFYRMLPTKSLVKKGDMCSGGKNSKERLTIFLCASLEGEIKKPLVIGKSARPRPFRHLDRNTLPVHWRFNKKAWMTSTIMEEWLHMFNEKMKIQKRNILLFLDNATCHPHISLSNIKLAWFPANTTSITQPLDQGIIQNFKCIYRKFLLKSLVLKLNDCTNVAELCRAINILDAVYFISKAVKSILPSTVTNCFIKAGFPSGDVQMDLHDDIDGDEEMSELCCRANLDVESGDVLHFDDNLPVFEDVIKAVAILDTETESEDEDESVPESERQLKIKTFAEALNAVNELEEFAASKNCPQLLDVMQNAKEIIYKTFCKSSNQTTITDFFKRS